MVDLVEVSDDKLKSFVSDPSLIEGDTEFLAMHNNLSSRAKDLKPKYHDKTGFSSVSYLFLPDKKSCKLHLDHAITFLRNIYEVNREQEKQTYTK